MSEPQISLTVRDGDNELTVFGAASLLPALIEALTGGSPVVDPVTGLLTNPRTGEITSYPYPLEARARRQAAVARARWHTTTPTPTLDEARAADAD